MPAINLLTDAVFPVEFTDGGCARVDLPRLLERLARDEVSGLPFLRAHQRFPFHAFLVQLAALALRRDGGEAGIASGAEAWRARLRALTAAWPGDEPWALLVEDLSRPAFLQPPVPEGSLSGFKEEIVAPDDLDVLISSRDFGVKQTQAMASEPATWIAALLILQTTGGYGGRDKYGVARMNGGFATRPGVGLAPEGGPGARWRRDVAVLLRRRDWFFKRREEFAREGGAALLWCIPWAGDVALGLPELDPWFVEVCRRVRVVARPDGKLAARTKPTKTARVAAGELKGNVADPWIPIDLGKDSAAYNTAPRYGVVADVLFDPSAWVTPLLLAWHEGIDGAPMTARFEILVRGEGKTEGYHDRSVRFAKKAAGMFASASGRDQLARLAKEMVENARAALGGKMLRTALIALFEGGPERVDFGNKTATRWADAFTGEADRAVDRAFFDHLMRRVEDEEAGRRRWLEFLRDLLAETFERAARAAPLAGARRPRAIARAEGLLWGSFYSTFTELRTTPKDDADAA